MISNDGRIGEIHNDFMDYVLNDFELNNDVNNKEDALNSLSDFYKLRASNYFEDSDYQSEFKNNVDNYINYVDAENVISIIVDKSTLYNAFRNSNTNFTVLVDDLLSNNVITQDEHTNINNLKRILTDVFDKQIDILEFNSELSQLEQEIDIDEQFIFKSSLEIANASSNWWSANNKIDIFDPEFGTVTPGNPNYQSMAIPVALDAAGALLGACGTATVQALTNNGEVTGGAVLTGAVVGAITASTGAVGHIARVFKLFF